MRVIRICVILAVVVVTLALVCFGRVPWSYPWLFAVLCATGVNLYWAWANRRTKPVPGSRIVWLFSVLQFVVYSLPLSSVPVLGWRVAPRLAAIEVLGAVLCAAGLVVAIRARRELAGSWCNVPALRENHALVTTGPYARVRHPIYLGFILLSAGAILALPEIRGCVWLVDIVVFVRRSRIEEGILRERYPREYPEYANRVKRLVPWIW